MWIWEKKNTHSVMYRDSTMVYTVTLSYLRNCSLIVKANTLMRKPNAEVQRLAFGRSSFAATADVLALEFAPPYKLLTANPLIIRLHVMEEGHVAACKFVHDSLVFVTVSLAIPDNFPR